MNLLPASAQMLPGLCQFDLTIGVPPATLCMLLCPDYRAKWVERFRGAEWT